MNNHGVQIEQEGNRFYIGGERAERYGTGMRVVFRSYSYVAKIGVTKRSNPDTPHFGVNQVENEIKVWRAASRSRRKWLAKMVGYGRAELNLRNRQGKRVYLFDVQERVRPMRSFGNAAMKQMVVARAEKLGLSDIGGSWNWMRRESDGKPVIYDYGLKWSPFDYDF